MAQRRRYRSNSKSRSAPRRSGGGRRAVQLSPHAARSLLGLLLLILGAVTLVALLFPAQGLLSRYVDDILRPNFGVGAWLLALLLIVAGIFVERDRSVGNGWAVTAVGGLLVFVSGLGLIHLLSGRGGAPAGLRDGGGAIGFALSGTLSELAGGAGALVLLVGLVAGGLILLLNTTLRDLLRPLGGGGRALAGAVRTPILARGSGTDRSRDDDRRRDAERRREERETARRDRRDRAPVPVMGADAGSGPLTPAAPEMPKPLSSPAPISQTVWSNERSAAAIADSAAVATTTVVATERPWQLPSLALLDQAQPPPAGADLDHAAQRAHHRGEAAQLPDSGECHRHQHRAGRDAVRGAPGRAHQAVAHRGTRRRPGDGPGRALDPHRGAHPRS